MRIVGILSTGSLVILGAIIAGGQLNVWRSGRAPDPTAQAIAAAAPASQPAVTAAITRDQAVELVRSLGEVVRVDQIAAKLVPWSEFEPVGMGADRTGGKGGPNDFPPQSVWAVAVAGDTYPTYWGGGAPRHFAWSLWGIDASRLQVVSLKVGDAGIWPPGFDGLADHIAVGSPAPTPSPQPIRFDHLTAGAYPLQMAIRDLVAADAEARRLWAVVSTDAADVERSLMRSDDGGASWSAVAGVTARPDRVAALGSIVLVSDAGADTAQSGRTRSGGLFVSTDSGTTWQRVSSDGVMRLQASSSKGRALFIAEHWWPTSGAATGPSRIFASTDAKTWREIGVVPGPVTSLGLGDVPLVTYSKNVPGDGVYRVEGSDLASLRLISIPGSPHLDGALTSAPGGALWSFVANGEAGPRQSTDGGRTWHTADAGLSGRIAGLFVWHGALYAVGDGAYQWDGARWRAASVLAAKVTRVFQVGDWVFLQQGTDAPWRSPR